VHVQRLAAGEQRGTQEIADRLVSDALGWPPQYRIGPVLTDAAVAVPFAGTVRGLSANVLSALPVLVFTASARMVRSTARSCGLLTSISALRRIAFTSVRTQTSDV